MQIKRTLLATSLVALLITPAMAVESLSTNPEIYGRSVANIEASLAEQGIDASKVETWGNVLRVDARAADGSSYMVLVDKDTLRPLSHSGHVATQTDLGMSTGSAMSTNSGWTISDAVANPQSLE